VRVEFGTQIDVALRLAQGAEIFAQILRIGVTRDRGGHHERGVDHLAEAELLEEVIGAAE